MFSIYGTPGLTFVGSLEELHRVNALRRSSAVRNIVAKGDDVDRVDTVFISRPQHEAIKAYQAAVQPDIERGPLYHAHQIMSRTVITLQDEDDVAQAWHIFREHRIHQAPVLNAKNMLVGIVSERELLTTINIENGKVIDAMHLKVRDVMTSPVVAAAPETDIRRIATVMLNHDVDGVPIINANHELVGFISRTDILHAVITEPPLSLWR